MKEQRYTVDGMDENDYYYGSGTHPPFSIFDSTLQDHLSPRFRKRWMAELVCWLIVKFSHPRR